MVGLETRRYGGLEDTMGKLSRDKPTSRLPRGGAWPFFCCSCFHCCFHCFLLLRLLLGLLLLLLLLLLPLLLLLLLLSSGSSSDIASNVSTHGCSQYSPFLFCHLSLGSTYLGRSDIYIHTFTAISS